MYWLARFIYFKILGWKLVGNITFSQEDVKKSVIISAPHTSNMDFFMGLMIRKIAKLKSNFIGKKELFIWPLGLYFKSVGGIPLDRTPGQDKVQAIANLFSKHEEVRITLSPEGTRKKVENWKSGFYYVALKAKVPIIMFTMDFGKKQNLVSEPFYPTGNYEEDIIKIKDFFKDAVGKNSQFT